LSRIHVVRREKHIHRLDLVFKTKTHPIRFNVKSKIVHRKHFVFLYLRWQRLSTVRDIGGRHCLAWSSTSNQPASQPVHPPDTPAPIAGWWVVTRVLWPGLPISGLWLFLGHDLFHTLSSTPHPKLCPGALLAAVLQTRRVASSVPLLSWERLTYIHTANSQSGQIFPLAILWAFLFCLQLPSHGNEYMHI